MGYYGYRKSYTSLSARRAKALREMAKLRKQGVDICPVEVEGRKIARTFWGEAWCDHLEKFSDYSNRLPRGKSYLRNGLVCHMKITRGEIEAIVSGSELYMVKVSIAALPVKRWDAIKKRCMGQIASVLELLQGKLSDNVMDVVTDTKTGLFPHPGEIQLGCDCPDWSSLCKHLAAVLYGVGAMLDRQPELLFTLRGVNHEDMVSADIYIPEGQGERRRISGDVGDVFGIDLENGGGKDNADGAADAETARRPGKKSRKPTGTARSGGADGEKPRVFRGRDVVSLRRRLGLGISEFARLIGASAGSVRKWESTSGRLSLRRKSRDALEKAANL